VQSKLVLLTIHFPKLRLLWAPTPSSTVDMIIDLKNDKEDPFEDDVAAAGTDQLLGQKQATADESQSLIFYYRWIISECSLPSPRF